MYALPVYREMTSRGRPYSDHTKISKHAISLMLMMFDTLQNDYTSITTSYKHKKYVLDSVVGICFTANSML
jgi:hypothetical protein